VNRVKSREFKMAVFVCTSHVLFSYRKFTLFCEFNFRCWLDQQNILTFPNLWYLKSNREIPPTEQPNYALALGSVLHNLLPRQHHCVEERYMSNILLR